MNRKYRDFFIIVLPTIAALLVGILSNIASNFMGGFFEERQWVIYILLLVSVITSIILAILARRADSPDQISQGKPFTLLREERVPVLVQMVQPSQPKTRLEQPLTWKDLCKHASRISTGAAARISGKYDKDFYVPRKKLQATVDHFIHSEKLCFVLVGKNGAGKSTFLMDLYERRSMREDVCLLMYDGAVLNPFQRLEDLIAEDFQHLLPGAPYIDILQVLSNIQEPPAKQLVICIDAINENSIQPQELLKRIDGFARRAVGHGIKVIITSRPETWRIIRSDVPLAEDLYYRQDIYPSALFKPRFEFSAELNYFDQAETELAYENHRVKLSTLPPFGELRPEVQLAIRDPLILKMVVEKLYRGDIPNQIQPQGLIKEYLQFLVKDQTSVNPLKAVDIDYLNQVLMPLMINTRFKNRITLDDLKSLEANEEPESISILEIANSQRSRTRSLLDHPFYRLVDAQILGHSGSGDQFEIYFEQERFWDYFGGIQLYTFGKQNRQPGSFYINLIRDMKKHPFMWGVCLNAFSYLIENRDDRTLVQVASSEAEDSDDLVTAALADYAIKDRERVTEFLHRLSPRFERRSLGSGWLNCAIIAIDVAGKLGDWDFIERASKSRSPIVRDRAVVQLYTLWKSDHQKGFEVLNRLVQQIRLPNVLLFPGLLSTCLVLSLLIYLRHRPQEDGLGDRLLVIWRGVVEQFRRFIRSQPLGLLISVAANNLNAIPSRYSIMSLGEVRKFYLLPSTVKAKLRLFLSYLQGANSDPVSMRILLDDLFHTQVEGKPLNNMLVKLVIDYSLVSLGTTNPGSAVELANYFGHRELNQSKNTLRLQWDKNWVFAALAFLQENQVDSHLFDAFTKYFEDCFRHEGQWKGSLGSYALIGYADYVYIYVRKHQSYAVEPIIGMMTWAVERNDHQKVLDIMEEMGYLAGSLYYESVLHILCPALSYAHNYPEGPPSAGQAPSPKKVQEKLIEVLARVRATNSAALEDFFVRQQVPQIFQSKVRAHKTKELVAGDLLKGGLGAWSQFSVQQGFSQHGRPVLVWMVQEAILAKSLDIFLVRAVKRLINILYHEEIFSEVNVPSTIKPPSLHR